MYPGWMIIGTSDPLGVPGAYTEIVNSTRAYAYADYAGLCWLNDCSECDAAAVVTPGYPYTTPISDPAPWYDANDPDSWGFLGVIGLDVQGADNSTRQATVTMSLTGGGVIGPTYMAPRAMVVRALAIATDDCSLQFGLTWLRGQYGTALDPCAGDTLTFFDCCPCVCADDTHGSTCWASNYGQLAGTPTCLGDEPFWPDTYSELILGPPADVDTWCTWAETYRDLRMGPPDLSCCVDACVTPYMRQHYNARVTEGPTVLQRPALNSPGAVAEIEFTVTAADPVVHAIVTRAGRTLVHGSTPHVDTFVPPLPFMNPDRPPRELPVSPAPLAASWLRDEIPVRRMHDQVLPGVEPRVRVRAMERSGPVRLGLWAGEHRLGGYTIPFVAAHSSVVVNGRDAYYSTPTGYERLPAFVRDWDGKWPGPLELAHGDYTLTVDQDAANPVRLLVDVGLAPIGSE